MTRGVLALIAIGLSGCWRSIDRTDRILEHDAGLLWSNSPVLLDRSSLTLADGLLEVRYPLLFENRGEPAALLLSRARVELGEAWATAESECRARHQRVAADLSLMPGASIRVDCRLRVTPRGMELLRRRDAELVLSIPVRRSGRLRELSFSYRLYYEDAT